MLPPKALNSLYLLSLLFDTLLPDYMGSHPEDSTVHSHRREKVTSHVCVLRLDRYLFNDVISAAEIVWHRMTGDHDYVNCKESGMNQFSSVESWHSHGMPEKNSGRDSNRVPRDYT
jgi:hypothetical protein